MRIIILACIPLISALIGYFLSFRYGEAKDFWDKFEFWHKKIKNEISFTQNSLPDILAENDDKSTFFSSVKEYFSSGNLPDIKFLSAEEREFFLKYLQNIGTSDKQSQLAFLSSMEAELFSYAKTYEEKFKKFRPLYVKLGFLSGLIIFILAV